jgi:hypothetical protein
MASAKEAASANLLAVPVEVRGEWHAPPQSADTVILRMREACLAGLRLRSDRQPAGLWAENRASGPPSVWLHETPAKIAWVNVDVGERDWCKLAYQFGHELGHVFCNSWQSDASPRPPCQWLEESLVEAFSVRGLGLLAEGWAQNPPFPGDSAFAASIRAYRADILKKYKAYAEEQGAADLPVWFRVNRGRLDESTGLSKEACAIVPQVLGAFDKDQTLIEDYAALNRWPGRSSVPIEEYLRCWRESCADIGAPGRLPVHLRKVLEVW